MSGRGQLEGARAVVTGGVGFLGSHLCDRLLDEGAEVIAIDNLVTGPTRNLDRLMVRRGFTFIDHDVSDYVHVPGDVDYVLHLASPASPSDYLRLPIQTLKVGALGTHKTLGLAKDKGATFMLASTSEVYGDPQVNPQPETYWGHVNPVGPRGVYDEAKRFAEALTYAYHRTHDVDVRVSRTFNSILADEQVLFDDGRSLRRERVGDVASRSSGGSELHDVHVPAFAGNGEMSAARAIALIGHPSGSRCYEVRARYGRSIRVTGDHSLFVEGPDGSPVARRVTDLELGDRIAVAGRLEVIERDRACASVIEAWDRAERDPWDLTVAAPGLGESIWTRRQEAVSTLMSFRGRTGSDARRSIWGEVCRYRSNDRAPLGLLRRLSEPIPPGATVRLRTAGPSHELPVEIDVSNDLLWFLGLFVAEGCRHESSKSWFITVSGDRSLLERAEKILRRAFGVHVVRSDAQDERSGAIFIHSRLLLALLDDLGFAGNEKRIPGWILGLPLPRLKYFLEGYREGDGVHSGEKFEDGEILEFSTTSEHLKDDLIVALTRFGLVPSIGRYETRLRERTGDRLYPFWRVSVHNVSPWSPLEWDEGVHQSVNGRRTGDIVWAPVKEIVEIPPTDLVYDFCVPGKQNFWAGTGVMAHNTYGPHMRLDDGRAVPTFIAQALRGEPITVHGDGSQTRSLCYVDDQIEGMIRLITSGYTQPVNVGNPLEVTVLQLAETVRDVCGSDSEIVFTERPEDDPTVRCPDTTVAERELGWKARVPLRDGLERTVAWFREVLDA